MGFTPHLHFHGKGKSNFMRTKAGNGTSVGSDVDADRLMEDIKTVVRDGQELLKARYDDVREKALARTRITDRKVRQNPYQSLGIVFAAGLLLGVLACGMSRRHE
jgi:ElaB/YqjD/DUF883 family membrane-anchored ribosome-binding protein